MDIPEMQSCFEVETVLLTNVIDVDYTSTKGGRTNVDFFIKGDVKFNNTIST